MTLQAARAYPSSFDKDGGPRGPGHLHPTTISHTITAKHPLPEEQATRRFLDRHVRQLRQGRRLVQRGPAGCLL